MPAHALSLSPYLLGVPAAEPPAAAALVAGQQWSAWDRGFALSQCKPLDQAAKHPDAFDDVSAKGCAEHWRDGDVSDEVDGLSAVFTALIKDTRTEDLLRQIEYHALLGVSQFVLFDNSCSEDGDYSKLETALAPYIAKRRLVLRTEYRCADASKIFPELYPIGGSGIALQTIARAPELHPNNGTLILALDDDEYVVLERFNQTLAALRDELLAPSNHGAVQLPWRIFGSSWHVCQPKGSVVRNFVHRGPRKGPRSRPESTDKLRQAQTDEATASHLNQPFSPHSGKFAVLWRSAEQIQMCLTHYCGPRAPGAFITRTTTSAPSARSTTAWLAHYAYQSEQHWEAKKARGRTTTGAKGEDREGPTPPGYNLVFDDRVESGVKNRIRRVLGSAQLRMCLQTLFGPPPAHSTGSDATTGTGPVYTVNSGWRVYGASRSAEDLLKLKRSDAEPRSCRDSGGASSSAAAVPAHFDLSLGMRKTCCVSERKCSVKQGDAAPEELLKVETVCSESGGRCLVLPSNTSEEWLPEERETSQ